MGTRSIAPDGLCVASRATRAEATSPWLGLFGKSKDSLADDVALDLGGAAPDRLRAREEERRLQHARRVALGDAPAPVAGHLLLGIGVAGEHLAVHPEDVDREVHRLAVRLRPEHLVG